MNKVKLIVAIIAIAGSISAFAQQKEQEEPKGTAIIQVFSNFHTGFGGQRNDRGFELDRSYLGYQYNLGKGLTVKGVMDIGQSNDVDDYHHIAYIKNALISWKTGKLTLSGGLIPTVQFNMQEKFWGYRYIMKSFQDQYKFGNSADLGISATYQFTNWFSADAIIANGEGYKKIQVNDGMLYGIGATLSPLKGLSIRIYGGFNESVVEDLENTTNFATFIGYKADKFSVGVEYNSILNSGFTKDAHMQGYSIYGSAKLNKNTEIYARFDDLSSKNDWNIKKDESAFMAGLQFKLGKYVKLAPNFRMNMPKMDGADDKYMAYISCYFGL